MELRHLRHFVAVADTLNFARAAQRLGMEQSPLSHSIRNLEAELGTPLFQRTTRRTWLTRAGTRFYPEALRILELAEAARMAVRDNALDPTVRFAVGLSEHAAGEPFTRFLFELEHRTPSINVDVREIAPAEAARQLEDRVIDLAIVLEPIEVPGLRRVRAWGEPLSLIAAMSHPLADATSAPLSALADQKLLIPHAHASPGYAVQVQALLSRHGVRPAKHVTVKHQNTMVSFASTGRGIALLPESIAHGLTTVAVLPLNEGDAEIVSWLIYRDEGPSEPVSFALEVAAIIDEGGALPSDERARV